MTISDRAIMLHGLMSQSKMTGSWAMAEYYEKLLQEELRYKRPSRACNFIYFLLMGRWPKEFS